ncbi:MAG: tRNA pseudouridine(38-40) synthase TruA [Bacteroidales bacterium]|nr:tRNA pseudouridine(38-40) synthase TruA [Bacteroidales bacterium]
MRYRIDMAYDGSSFCGWQIQPSSPSVQEEVEKALATLLKAPVGVVGAGRTDTGVNASRYVAHFDFPDGELDCNQLRYKMNAILPKSVAIQNIAPAAPDFHARFGATCRQYQYFLHRVKDPFMEGRSYYYGYPQVDFEAMNRAASALLGTHDFSCFEKSGGDNKTSICTVYSARWETYSPALSLFPAACAPEAPYWRFTIEADRFLRNMVRAVVGTLLEVGRGKRSEADFAALVLDAGESGAERPVKKESLRSNAGESVPGHALFLTDIRY